MKKSRALAAAAAVLVFSASFGSVFAASEGDEGELLMEEEATESLEEGDGPAEKVTGSRQFTLTDTAFESVVLIDTEAVGMYAESDDTDMSDGYTWQLHIENRTDDYIAVTLADAAVNSFMCASDAWGSSSWALSADSDMDTEVTWSREALDAIGAVDILEVMFSVWAYSVDENGENTYLAQTDVRAVYDMAGSGSNVLEDDHSGEDLITGENYIFRILDITGEGAGVSDWNVYLENNSGNTVLYELSNVRVNGFAQDVFWSQTVLPGKKALAQIPLWSLEMIENDITDITKVVFDLQIWTRTPGSPEELSDVKVFTRTVYPMGEEAALDEYVREPQESDIALYSQDDASVSITEIEKSDVEGYLSLRMYAENRTKEAMTFIASSDAGETVIRVPAEARKFGHLLVSDSGKISLEVRNEQFESISSDDYEIDLVKGILHGETPIPANETLVRESEETQDTPAGEAPDGSGESGENGGTEETAVTEEASAAEDTTAAEESAAEDDGASGEETKKDDVTEYTDQLSVSNVQAALYGYGYDCGIVDGRIGDLTRQKIREYRSAKGLADTDVIDRELLESLGLTDPATMKKVQEFLTGEGYDLGTPDGMIGSKTRAAVKNYKEEHGLTADGMIDREFLESAGIEW